MKRPTIALFSILSLLALGLAACGPKSCEAGSLGELAFAIQIESTSTGDPIVCPLVCCPYADEVAEAAPVDEPQIELNAAATTDANEELAASDNDDEYYYDDYGWEYGDEYEADETAEDVAGEVADNMELNAPATTENEHLADGCFEEYYGDYAYDYTEFGEDYTAGDYEDDVSPADECNDVCHGPVEFPKVEAERVSVQSQISDADLDPEADCDRAMLHPYDCYGRQLGDDCTADEYADDEIADDADESYADNDDNYYDDNYYDDYYEESYYEDYYGDYWDDAEYTEGGNAAETNDTFEEDYERYYSQEYYDSLEEPAAAEETQEAAAESDEGFDDYTSEYDAIYDKAVYGDGVVPVRSARLDLPSPPVVDEECLAATCLREAYLSGHCIDERSAEVYDDLPWADELTPEAEVATADVAQIDIPEETVDGIASEYGSDYAEEYYEAYFDWIESQEALEADASNDEAASEEAELEPKVCHPQVEACRAPTPTAAAKTVRSTFDISRLATYCGSRVAMFTESLQELGRSIRTAGIDLGTTNR